MTRNLSLTALWLAPADVALAAACYGLAAWIGGGAGPGFQAVVPAALAMAAAVRLQGASAVELPAALGLAFLVQAGLHRFHPSLACPLPVMLAGSLLALAALFCRRRWCGAARPRLGLSVVGYMERPGNPPARRGAFPHGESALPAPLAGRLAAGGLTPPGRPSLGGGRAAAALLLAAPLLLAAAALGAAHPGPAEIE